MKVRCDSRMGRLAGARMVHGLCALDPFSRQQAVLLGCVPALVTMMDKVHAHLFATHSKADLEEQEVASLALCVLAKDKVIAH